MVYAPEHHEHKPLILGAIVSLLLHAVAVPAILHTRQPPELLPKALWEREPATAQADPLEEPEAEPSAPPDEPPRLPEPEPPPQPRIGSDDGTKITTMAWISHDDFQQLLTPIRSDIEQPALQRDVEPTPQAPMPEDPTPAIAAVRAPARPARDEAPPEAEAQPQPPQVERQMAPESVADAREQRQPQLPREAQEEVLPQPPPQPMAGHDLDLPRADLALVDTLRARVAQLEAMQMQEVRPSPPPQPAIEAMPEIRPAPAFPPREQAEASLQATPPSAVTSSGRPTSAPMADSEAPPVAFTEFLRVVPGRVVTGEGIEIKTVKPRFGIVTRISMLPHNPVVRIRFDQDGKVLKAWIVRTSGYPSVDSPLVASMYEWRATGRKLEEFGRPFELTIDVILLAD